MRSNRSCLGKNSLQTTSFKNSLGTAAIAHADSNPPQTVCFRTPASVLCWRCTSGGFVPFVGISKECSFYVDRQFRYVLLTSWFRVYVHHTRIQLPFPAGYRLPAHRIPLAFLCNPATRSYSGLSASLVSAPMNFLLPRLTSILGACRLIGRCA